MREIVFGIGVYPKPCRVNVEALGTEKAHSIFYVDVHGQEITLKNVSLPWSYGAQHPSDARVAAAVSQRGGRPEIELQFFRDGEQWWSTRVPGGPGSSLVTGGYDSAPPDERLHN